MSDTNHKQPGDLLLDRYFPGADAHTRERALHAFRDFAAFLLRLSDRLTTDEHEPLDSTNKDMGARIEVAPREPPQ